VKGREKMREKKIEQRNKKPYPFFLLLFFLRFKFRRAAEKRQNEN